MAVGSAAALIVFGLMMVLDTTYFMGLEKTGNPFYFFERQLLNLAVGIAVIALVAQFWLRGLRLIAFPLIAIAAVMLLAVWVPGLGLVRGGARRWLRAGPIPIEPSEMVKLATVFFLARYLSDQQENLSNPKFLAPAFAVVGMLAIVLLKQPDFGAAVMLTLVLFTMLFAAGAENRHLGIAGSVALLALVIQVGHKAYRMRRLSAFLNPWRTAQGSGFQLIQSFIAFGAGGGWAWDSGASRQKMFYLPQAHNDFVFAVCGRGIRRGWRAGGDRFVRHDFGPWHAHRAQRGRLLRQSAGGRDHRTAVAAGVREHGGGNRAGPDQRITATIS